MKSSESLIFVEKQKNCEQCDKEKEVTLKFDMVNNEEWITIMKLLEKMKITSQETEYIYNFYNRVFGTKKRPGCAKCMRNIAIHLKNRWNEMNK